MARRWSDCNGSGFITIGFAPSLVAPPGVKPVNSLGRSTVSKLLAPTSTLLRSKFVLGHDADPEQLIAVRRPESCFRVTANCDRIE